MQAHFLKYSVLSICMASILTACGGGSSSSPSTSPSTISGAVIDGYLAFSTITFENCAGRPTTLTDKSGNFSVSPDSLGVCTDYSMSVSGGYDLTTAKFLGNGEVDTANSGVFKGTLKLKDNGSLLNTKISVNPLTTLKSYFTGTDAQFATLLTQQLGFPAGTDIYSYDPVQQKDAKAEAKFLLIQNILDSIILAGGDVDEFANSLLNSTPQLFPSNGSPVVNGEALDAILTESNNGITINTASIEALSTLLNGAANNTTGSLSDYLQNNTDIIDDINENLDNVAKAHSGLKFVGNTTTQLAAANSVMNAIGISKTNLLNELTIEIDSTSTAGLNDKIQLAFEIEIQGKGTIKALVNDIQISLNDSGKISNAKIPRNAYVYFSSSDGSNTLSLKKAINSDYILNVTDNKISANDLLTASSFVSDNYNSLKDNLAINDIIAVKTYVKSTTYPISDSNLVTGTTNFEDSQFQFSGSTLSAYFKLQ